MLSPFSAKGGNYFLLLLLHLERVKEKNVKSSGLKFDVLEMIDIKMKVPGWCVK